MSYYAANLRWHENVLHRPHEKQGFFDYSNEAANYLYSIDASVFRIEKNYESAFAGTYSLNDAKVQGYMGLENYASNNHPNYILFLQSVGLLEGQEGNGLNYIYGASGRPVLETFFGVKYYLVKGYSPLPDYFTYTATKTTFPGA